MPIEYIWLLQVNINQLPIGTQIQCFWEYVKWHYFVDPSSLPFHYLVFHCNSIPQFLPHITLLNPTKLPLCHSFVAKQFRLLHCHHSRHHHHQWKIHQKVTEETSAFVLWTLPIKRSLLFPHLIKQSMYVSIVLSLSQFTWHNWYFRVTYVA